MPGFGDALRHARANKGVTLTEAERAIRIPRKYLRALEDEDFYTLPEGVYSRGIVRNYAQYLNLDPDDAISYFDEVRGGVSGGFKVVPAVKPMEMPSHWAPNFALIAFVVVISAVLFAWLYSAFFAASNTANPLPTPSVGVPTPTVIDVQGALLALTPTATATAVPPTQAPAAPPSSAAPSQAPPSVASSQAPVVAASTVPQGDGAIHVVTIRALEDAWVTVMVDGVVEHEAVLAADGSLNYEGKTIVITSSNATNVYLWVNGADYGLVSESASEGSISIP